MVFSSVIFLFFFLPVVLVVHTLLPARARNVFLLLVSVLFYAWGEARFLWVMFTSSLLDYFAGLLIGLEYERQHAAGSTGKSKTPLQKTRSRCRWPETSACSLFSSTPDFLPKTFPPCSTWRACPIGCPTLS